MPRLLLWMILLVCCGLPKLRGQSFQKEYSMTGSTSVIPYGTAQRPDGSFLVSHLVREDDLRLHVTCLSASGEPLWSTRLSAHFNGDNATEGIKKTPILATADNSCIVLVAKSLIATGQGWAMVKLSPDGLVQWSREITGVGSVEDILGYSNGRIYLLARYWSFDSKPYMACLDDNGNVLWEKKIVANLDNIVATGLRILPNQSMLLTLAESSFLLQTGHVARLTANGDLINLLALPNLSLLSANEHPDGRLFFLARTLDSINLKNQVLLGSAQNGALLWLKALDLPQDFYFSGILSFNAASDSLVASFRASFFEAQRYWIRFDLNGNPGAAHYIPSTESPGNEIIPTLGGGFAWVSNVLSSGNVSSFIFSKTNAQALLENCPAGNICGLSVRDTFFPLQAPGGWATQMTSQIIMGNATQQSRSVTAVDYCHPLPILDAGILANDTSGCGDETFTFKRLAPATGLSTWNFFSGTPAFFLGAEPPEVVFPDTGIFQVRHILNQAGCLDTASLDIQVSDYPALSLPEKQVLCLGESFLLDVEAATDLDFLWNDGVTSASRILTDTGQYVLTVSNPAGCQRSDSISILLPVLPATLWQSDTFFCKNGEVSVSLGESAGWEYTWGDGFPEQTRVFSEAGSYALRIVSPEDCMLNDSLMVQEKSPPQINIAAFLPYACGGRRLEAQGASLVSVSWNTGDTLASIEALQSGLYTLSGSDGFCGNRDSVQVEILPCPACDVYIPGVFRPASVTGNHAFAVQSACGIGDFQLRVYDRWGNVVFESRDPNVGWDGILNGRLLSPGVYLYQVKATLFSGDAYYPFLKNGDVTLVR